MSETTDRTEPTNFEAQREKFITTWGAMGSSWGINRTLSMIHALLWVTPGALTTEEIMKQLEISRGNANTNLRELVSWGLVRVLAVKGERKDYFEAEKDVWKIFCAVVRGRKQREIDPVLGILKEVSDATEEAKSPEEKEFNRITSELYQFVETSGALMDRVARSERSKILPLLIRIIGK